MAINLPAEIEAVLREFRVCEFSTMAKDGTPITWPVVARYDGSPFRFVLTTSIGLPQKAFNIRRNPRVSLLFSDPTGSGLEKPPAVLVQGLATAPDNVVVSVDRLQSYWQDSVFSRQPASEFLSSNVWTQKLMDWYYMRIVIFVAPQKLWWWPEADFSHPARVLEVQNVG